MKAKKLAPEQAEKILAKKGCLPYISVSSLAKYKVVPTDSPGT
jgi:hypothetical protein